MRFRTFLKESTDIVSVIKGGFKQNFIAMYEGKIAELYRGMRPTVAGEAVFGDVKFAVVPKMTSPRRSLTENDILLKFTATSPKWKDVPNRQLSAMAGTDPETAEGFGTPWLIIPADNVTKFACSEEDFNKIDITGIGDSFLTMTSDFNELYEHYLSVQSDLDDRDEELDQAEERLNSLISSRDFDTVNLDQLSDSINLLLLFDDRLTATERQVIEKVDGYADLTKIARGLTHDGALTLSQMFDKYVTPANMDVTVGSLPAHGKRRYDEVWFEGSYLAIRSTIAHEYDSFTINNQSLKDIYDEVKK